MLAPISGSREPALGLGIEIGIVQERAAVKEALAQVTDRALDLALGLCAVRSARPRPEAPVGREAQELGVEHQRAAAQSVVADDDRAHLIEQQLLWDAAERGEGALEPGKQCLHVLAGIKPQPEQPRVPQHDHQRIAPAPRQVEGSKIYLPLESSGRLESPHRIVDRPWPDLPNVLLQLGISAAIAGCPDFLEHTLRG